MNRAIGTNTMVHTWQSKSQARRTRAFAFLFALAALLPSSAWADETATSGQVALIDGANESGFAFRLVGFPQLCNAYLGQYGAVQTADGATQEKIKYMLAQVTAAKLSGTSVTVFASPSSTGVSCAVRAIVW